jgi:nucleotide-binding universal stress UspA family protein
MRYRSFAHSENVLDWAARLAGSFEARLFLIHAIPALAAAEEDYYQQDWREGLASGARDQLDALQQSVGTKAEPLVVAGDVPHTVCAQAEQLGADVLVIGRSSEPGLVGRLRTNAYAIIPGVALPGGQCLSLPSGGEAMFPLKKMLFPVDFSEHCIGASRFVKVMTGRFEADLFCTGTAWAQRLPGNG